mgnify:CR=1 FL=1
MFSSKIRLGLVCELSEFVKIFGGELAFHQTIASRDPDGDLTGARNAIDVVDGCLLTGGWEDGAILFIFGE